MTPNQEDRSAARLLVWPRSTADLLNRQLCPACFAALTGVVCGNCHLDLRDPRAHELLAASASAAGQLYRRAALIAEIRRESAARARQTAELAAEATAAADSAQGVHAVRTAPSPAVQQAPVAIAAVAVARTIPASQTASSASAVQPPPPGRGRSSVQILLLSLGVALVAVALIFFLIVAFFIADTTSRAVIIAFVTALVFATVSVLVRFRLTATAQGVAVLAALLVYLDLWGVQATNLLGAGEVSGLWFWGVALLLTAPALLLWFRFTGMRVGSIAASAAFPLGLGLIAGAVAEGIPGADAALPLWFAATAVLVGGLLHACVPGFGKTLAQPNRLVPERVILAVQAVVGGLIALVIGLTLSPESDLAPLWSIGAVALLCALHAWLSSRSNSALARVATAGFTSIAGAALAAVPLTVSLRAGGWEGFTSWPVLVAVALVAVAEAARTRTESLVYRLSLAAAAWSAGCVVAISAAVAVGTTLARYFELIPGVAAWPLWAAQHSLETASSVAQIQAVVFLAGAVGIVAATWAIFHLARRRVLALAVACATIAFASITVVPSVTIAVGAYLVLAICAVAALVLPAVRQRVLTFRGSTALMIAVATGGTLAAIPLSYATAWLWLATSVIVIALLLAARGVRLAPALPAAGAHAVQRTILLCMAVVGVLGIAITWPSAFATTGTVLPPDSADVQGLLVLSSGIALVVFSLPLPRFAAAAERSWALGVAACGLLSGMALNGSAGHGTFANPFVLTAAGTALAAGASLLLIGAPWNSALIVAKRSALLAVPPLVWAAGAWTFTALAADGQYISPLLPDNWAACVGLLSLAISLAFALSRASQREQELLPSNRLLLDVSAAVVLLGGLLTVGISWGGSLSWLPWLLAACGALLAAIDSAGLFNTRALRHHCGWVALALGVVALWMGLVAAGTTAPEPFTLPVAAALLAIAALIGRSGRNLAAAGSNLGYGGAALIGVGIAIGLIPSAIAGANGSLLRPIVVTALSGTILLLAAAWTAPFARTPVRSAILASSSIGVAMAAGARAASTLVSPDSSTSATLELWVLLGAGIFLAVALVIAADSPRVATVFVGAALSIGASLELLAITRWPFDDTASIRSVVVVLALSALYAAIRWRAPAFLGRWIAPLALGLAVATAAAALSVGAIGSSEGLPFELVTLPIALAWIAGGALRLARTPTLRSWPAIGGGLALLLFPSLVADYVDAPLWRVVGLGVVALAVLLIGVRLKLQAPFILGSVVLLLHTLAQLWPWISSVYNPNYWWLWFGLGGVLLIVLAARYERRVQNIKNAAAAISSLR